MWSVHAVGLSTQWASYLSFDTQRLGHNSTLANLLARRGPFSGRNATLSGIAVRAAIDCTIIPQTLLAALLRESLPDVSDVT